MTVAVFIWDRLPVAVVAVGVALSLWATGVLELDQSLAGVGKRLGMTIRKVELANPLAAVDVDKPADHALVSAILEGRA